MKIRGSGRVADRLRAYVRERVGKDGAHYARGSALRLAEALNKPPSWVSEYVAEPPARNADIDTALAICDFFNVNLLDFARVTSPGRVIEQRSKDAERIRELEDTLAARDEYINGLHVTLRTLTTLSAQAVQSGVVGKSGTRRNRKRAG